MEACRYALFQLPQIITVKNIGKLVLAGKNDLNQLFLVRFKVCQQSNFFEQFGA